MTLPSELISRLQALKALLDLGDVELASSAAARLQTHRETGSIAQIIECFGTHRYAEAGRLITTVLTEGTRIVRWTDPEITLLETELERLSSELAEAEAEQVDFDHQISRFHAAHHQSLGDRLARLLRLRLLVRMKAAAADPTKAEEAKEAQQDFDDFQKESTAQEAEDARTKWDLSEEEQQELKKLFRSASKKCHPDVVPVEHQAAAAAMFRDLTEAYQTGNLVGVRHLAAQAAAGVFTAAAEASAADQKATLQARIQAVRSALEKVRADLAAVQQSAAYHVMSQHPDWDAYFEIQAAKLDHEIERLSQAVEGSDS